MNRSQIKSFQKELFIRKVQNASDRAMDELMSYGPVLVAICIGVLLVRNLI